MATIQSASNRELLRELDRRIGGPDQPGLLNFIENNCDVGEYHTMTFADFFAATRHLGLSKIKLSQALDGIAGVQTYSGSANVRHIRGLKLRK